MLALTMIGHQSCSDDLHDVGDVQVNFTAMLPTDTRTRSFGKAEQVNTLVVGIFKKGVADVYTNNGGSWSYYEIDRQSFPINGTSVDVQLSLAQEQTYSFVFWAYDGNQIIYNIDDLTAIVMNPRPSPITFSEAEAMDAFFATMEDITITGDCSYSVELVRVPDFKPRPVCGIDPVVSCPVLDVQFKGHGHHILDGHVIIVPEPVLMAGLSAVENQIVRIARYVENYRIPCIICIGCIQRDIVVHRRIDIRLLTCRK